MWVNLFHEEGLGLPPDVRIATISLASYVGPLALSVLFVPSPFLKFLHALMCIASFTLPHR
jgi:hypothetical protein